MSADPRDSFCAISGLPISQGDPVLALPLAQLRPSDPLSPPYWVPISPPALGVYDAEHRGATELATTPGSSLCARALGFARVEALVEAARAGKVKEPKRPASALDEPSWLATGVSLVRPDAWAALLDMPIKVGSQGFEPSESSGALLHDLARAASEAVVWTRAAAVAVERSTGLKASDFPPATRLAQRDARLFQEFSVSTVYMSKDLPECEVFDSIFGRRAKGGVTLVWRSLEFKTERLAMLTLPRMGFSDRDVERAAFELCTLAGANHAWLWSLGRRWAPSAAAPAGRASRAAQWIWADKARGMAQAAALAEGPGDPLGELARAGIERAEIEGAVVGAASRARPASL